MTQASLNVNNSSSYMEFSQFKLMPIPVQAHIICEEGTLLAERVEDNCVISLFGVDSYYVEVYYRQPDDEILKIISFHSTVLLEPYISKINLDTLLFSTQLTECRRGM